MGGLWWPCQDYTVKKINDSSNCFRSGGQTAQNEYDAARVQAQTAAKRAREAATKAQDAAKVGPREHRRIPGGPRRAPR